MRRLTTSFNLYPELIEKLRAIAVKREVSMSKVVEKLLIEFVANEESKELNN